jgi:hypothetical protein
MITVCFTVLFAYDDENNKIVIKYYVQRNKFNENDYNIKNTLFEINKFKINIDEIPYLNDSIISELYNEANIKINEYINKNNVKTNFILNIIFNIKKNFLQGISLKINEYFFSNDIIF